MPITQHANGEPLLKRSSSYFPGCNDSACCLVCKRRQCSALTSKAYFQFTILTDAFVRVIVSSIQTNRSRCALYKKIFDLLDEESISGARSGKASL